MKVTLLGPWVDSQTGECVDTDLIRVGLSRHPGVNTEEKPIVVGQCRPSDGSVLLFPHFNFSEKDAADITSWAQDLMRQGKTTPQRIQQLMAKAPTTAAAVSTSEEPES